MKCSTEIHVSSACYRGGVSVSSVPRKIFSIDSIIRHDSPKTWKEEPGGHHHGGEDCFVEEQEHVELEANRLHALCLLTTCCESRTAAVCATKKSSCSVNRSPSL